MQLMVSTDIALRTLIYLGRKNEPATIQEVATAFDISRTHLMKVVMTLVGAGLLVSERGRKGGIRLAMDARDISVGTVVRLMENNLALIACMKDGSLPESCPLLPGCRLKEVFQGALGAFFASLDQSTLADLID